MLPAGQYSLIDGGGVPEDAILTKTSGQKMLIMQLTTIMNTIKRTYNLFTKTIQTLLHSHFYHHHSLTLNQKVRRRGEERGLRH